MFPQDLEADTDAIMGEDTAQTSSANTETEAQRSSSSQSKETKKELQPNSNSPDLKVEELKKEVSKDGI